MAVRDGALLNDTACKIRDPSREERKKEWEQRDFAVLQLARLVFFFLFRKGKAKIPFFDLALLFRLRVASILESSPSTFFTRVQAHQLFSTSRAPLFSSVKCSTSSLETAASRPNVVDILEERGLLESITSENLRSACSDPSVAPTAAVGLIGDPSGKSLERPELDALTLEKNIAGIKNILVKILGGNARLLCDFLITTMLDFLKNVGRFARVGQMMAKESVKKRLGSEQAGTDLIRKILQTEEDGAVWLSPSMLSPYKFYQCWKMRDEEAWRFSIVDVSGSSGLFESKSAARRLLKQGGVYMNNERVDDENKRVEVGT
ncbi:hypothetical protein HID58_003918 [Brassica napus]|uniref:Tyrosyl-tRNA synthetase n=1 Tax=Brassica napus TaxID=3708 RepID=A0ABQ8ERF0_BRANA|nr:hypothetical protein HID58_003918 [Brassica napus]